VDFGLFINGPASLMKSSPCDSRKPPREIGGPANCQIHAVDQVVRGSNRR